MSKKNYIGALGDAFSLSSLLVKISSFAISVGFIAPRQHYTTVTGAYKMQPSTWGFFKEALWGIITNVWSEMKVNLLQVWSVLISLGETLKAVSVGGIILMAISFALVFTIIYQPVSFIMQVLDGRNGMLNNIIVKIVATLIIMLAMMAILYLMIPSETSSIQQSVTQNVVPEQSYITNTNNQIATQGISVTL